MKKIPKSDKYFINCKKAGYKVTSFKKVNFCNFKFKFVSFKNTGIELLES